MKRKRFECQRERVQGLEGKWLKPLGLLWWRVEIYYFDSRKKWGLLHSDRAVMATNVDWPYRKAYIDVNVPLLATLSDADTENAFIHECMHILVEEMRAAGDDQQAHIERVCESLAQAFVWVRGSCENVMGL